MNLNVFFCWMQIRNSFLSDSKRWKRNKKAFRCNSNFRVNRLKWSKNRFLRWINTLSFTDWKIFSRLFIQDLRNVFESTLSNLILMKRAKHAKNCLCRWVVNFFNLLHLNCRWFRYVSFQYFSQMNLNSKHTYHQ